MHADADRSRAGSESGFGILLALILAAVIAVIILEVSRRSSSDLEEVGNVRAKTARESLYQRLHATAGVAETLFASFRQAAANPDLAKCLTSGAACGSHAHTKLLPLALYSPDGGRIAGGAPAPQYTQDGRPCTPPADCRFEARAFFWTQCKDALPTCLLPNTIHTLVQVVPLASAKAGPKLARMPTDAALASQTVELSNTVQVAQILAVVKTCPSESVLVKLTDGNLTCKCTTDQVGVDGDGMPICAVPGTCPAGKVFVGLDAQGNPKCIDSYDNCQFVDDVAEVFCDEFAGCQQLGALSVDCQSADGKPRRLRRLIHLESSDSCVEVPNPTKKAGDLGAYTCQLHYRYECCV